MRSFYVSYQAIAPDGTLSERKGQVDAENVIEAIHKTAEGMVIGSKTIVVLMTDITPDPKDRLLKAVGPISRN